MSNKLSRRSFLSGSASALAAASMTPLATSCQTAPAAHSFPGIYEFGSKFGGVQTGCTTYSFRSMPGGLQNCIKYCRETGINSIEFRSGPDLEAYLGAPQMPNGFPGGNRGLTPEQEAIRDKYNADLKAWRIAATPEKVATAKKLFDDAGIDIHIVKFTPGNWSDEEIDYAFRAAKAMGARGVSEEIGEEAVRRMAPYAEKHGLYAIFHNHAQFAQEGFTADQFLKVSPAVMLNFDTGHYFGSTGLDPCDFMRKYHDRIFSIHIKDKTGPNAVQRDANQVFGQGEMKLDEILLLLKKEGWPIYVDIELEYDIKPWSNQVRETKTCVQFMRNILI